MKALACAVTGHRPTRFKFKYKENTAGCKRLKKRLRDQFAELYEQGVRRFWVGGAQGVDMWAGEILLRLKETPGYGDLELHMALPGEKQGEAWDKRSRERLAFLIRHSKECVIVGKGLTAEDYRRRNQYMVDHADVLVAVYDDDHSIRSGTGMTVNYARKKELAVILIHPDTGATTNL